jgi:hypothetical protein
MAQRSDQSGIPAFAGVTGKMDGDYSRVLSDHSSGKARLGSVVCR